MANLKFSFDYENWKEHCTTYEICMVSRQLIGSLIKYFRENIILSSTRDDIKLRNLTSALSTQFAKLGSVAIRSERMPRHLKLYELSFSNLLQGHGSVGQMQEHSIQIPSIMNINCGENNYAGAHLLSELMVASMESCLQCVRAQLKTSTDRMHLRECMFAMSEITHQIKELVDKTYREPARNSIIISITMKVSNDWFPVHTHV